jgi:hypothetical protein
MSKTKMNAGYNAGYMQHQTDDVLFEWLRNASATYYGAGGHDKAERNKIRCELYSNELRKRGHDCPLGPDINADGELNGPGSR